MYLNAHTRVTVTLEETGNTFILPYVCSVKVSNDSQHIGATCDIVVPLNSRIVYGYDEKTQQALSAPTGNLFQTGDAVKIEAKYDGYDWVTIFEGFMFDFYEGAPLRIFCYDYIYKLNCVAPITVSYKKIKLAKLLENVLANTGVSLIPPGAKYTDKNGVEQTNPIFDMDLFNISFTSMTPSAILEHLKKELGFNISLDKDKLYYNIASNTINTVNYDTRYNIKGEVSLQPNTTKVRGSRGHKNKSVFQRIKVKAHFYNEANGKNEFVTRGDEDGVNHDVFFYNIDVRGKTDAQKEAIYNKLADEAVEKYKQRRFNGSIKTYLYPEVDLFFRAVYNDFKYPERSGVYVVTAQNITLDENGYERDLKLAFIGDIN